MSNIALGSIFIECNHFGGKPADIETFQRGGLFYGKDIDEQKTGTLGGMLEVLNVNNCEVSPLLAASACPSGSVTVECYQELKSDLINRLRDALPVDGVLLALHGAASADNAGDLEGDLLAAVRLEIGCSVPIVASLDLHAHVTAQMIESADAFLAWETYPHADAFSTGKRSAQTLLAIIKGELNPCMTMAKVPVVVGAVNGHTKPPGPFADVMKFAKSFEGKDSIWAVSCFLVHPYLDLPEMGGGSLVISHDDHPAAESLANELAMFYWNQRHDLEPTLFTPDEAIRKGLKIDGGPSVLVETADCCGGGAAGDSVHTLRSLLEFEDTELCIVPVVDPMAVKACHFAGEGVNISLELGHHVDSQWGEPIMISGIVVKTFDGKFTYSGGIWDGRQGDMGESAVVRVRQMQILITTHGTYDWGTEQLDVAGLDWSSAKFIVAKNPMNYRRAFADEMIADFVLDTPGPTPASVLGLKYNHLTQNCFPKNANASCEHPCLYHSVP